METLVLTMLQLDQYSLLSAHAILVPLHFITLHEKCIHLKEKQVEVAQCANLYLVAVSK